MLLHEQQDTSQNGDDDDDDLIEAGASSFGDSTRFHEHGFWDLTSSLGLLTPPPSSSSLLSTQQEQDSRLDHHHHQAEQHDSRLEQHHQAQHHQAHHHQAQQGESAKGCNCKRSGCLKLYCDCFAKNASPCTKMCRCRGCKNRDGLPERHATIHRMQAKHGTAAFDRVQRVASNGCNCTKGCKNAHCLCRRLGRACTPFCRCSCGGVMACCNNMITLLAQTK